MSFTEKRAVIYSLRESGMEFTDPSKDIREREFIGRDGKKMGTVDDLPMDDRQSRIRFVQIAHGGFLETFARGTFMLPINNITKVEDRKIHVKYTAEEVEQEASYLPELESGADVGPGGWFEQSPGGLPGVPIQ